MLRRGGERRIAGSAIGFEGAGGGWALAVAGVIALLAAAVALALELGFEGHDALWLDESWTGAIAALPHWRDVGRQIYWDVNAPLYYVLIRLWSGLAGVSDLALRTPSLIAAALTPLAAALWPAPGVPRSVRLAWGALLAFWFPALCYAQESRCYAVLLLSCTLQTLAYVRLIEAPGTRRAAVWAGLAALSILTHYDALYLGAAQGLLYVARYPVRALRSWPAALAFVPAFGWLAYHWPRIAQFARPDIAWYSPLRLSQMPQVLAYMVDGYASGAGILAWALLAIAVSAASLRLTLQLGWPDRRLERRPDWTPAAWAVLASAASAALLIGVGFLRPSFTFRYLTPAEPGLMLGVLLLVRLLAGRRLAPLALTALALAMLAASGSMLQHRLRMAPRRYNFEMASAALAKTRPTRLAFLWDHPVDPILHPEQLALLGGFFLHRAGVDTQVEPIVLKPGEDPNARLVAAAQAPGSAILWLYDTVVRGAAAIDHPPVIGRLDPAFSCRQFGSGRFGVVACVRRAEPGH